MANHHSTSGTLAVTTSALFFASHLVALGCAVKPALLGRPSRTTGTSAGRSMAYMLVSALLSYNNDFSQGPGLRLGTLEIS